MRIFLGIVLLFSFQWGNAQKQLPKISLSFTNATKKEVLHQIEEKSDFHFFYLDQWLGSEKISGDYKEIPLDEVLTAIFKDTEVNFLSFRIPRSSLHKIMLSMIPCRKVFLVRRKIPFQQWPWMVKGKRLPLFFIRRKNLHVKG